MVGRGCRARCGPPPRTAVSLLAAPLLAALALAACQPYYNAPPGETLPPEGARGADGEAGTPPGAGGAQGEGRLASGSAPLLPGDAVRVTVWREPDLSGQYHLDETGRAVFPLLGPRQLGGVPADSVERRLEAEFASFLENPSIQVTALRRIRVTGSVQQPGLYPVDATMTVADAVALAGGALPREGRLDRVRLIRGGRALELELGPETPLAETPLRSGDNLFVPERSFLGRNAGIIAGVLGTLLSVTAIIATN